MRSGSSVTAAVVACGLVLAACGGGDDAAAETSSTTASPTTTQATATTTTAAATTTTTTTEPELTATALTAAIQAQLRALGFLDGAIDGIYGPLTTAAVTAFQEDAGITADGEYGPATEDALVEAVQADKDFVEGIQEDLKEAGLYSGPVDGDYGSGTEKAVTALQEECDLEPPADGRFTPLTQVCLELALT
jgi:peptidoglycan hydrolase-like protein with peptidoglycan-binding domain